MKTATCSTLSFYEYMLDLRGLPENLKTMIIIMIITIAGLAKLKIISSIVKADALI
jgi:hypothetical protein